MMRFFRLALIVISIVSLLERSSFAQATSTDYAIGPQDVLAIVVFDQPDLSGKYAVEIDGSFTFPYVGRVKAGGLTIRAFEQELRTRLADGFFKDRRLRRVIQKPASLCRRRSADTGCPSADRGADAARRDRQIGLRYARRER
jgi:protein involved in polysaccharide export with SLBB domain